MRSGPQRQVELRLRGVDRDHRVRTFGNRPHDGAEANTAETDHDHGLARLHARRVPHRTDAGGHRAADQRGDLRWRGRIDLDGRRCGHDLLLTERADAAVRTDRRAIGSVEPDQLRRKPMAAAVRLAAQPRLTSRAAGARAAGRRPREHDEVADREAVDILADLLDPRGALVAHDHPGRSLPLAVHDVQVRVTDARGRHPDPNLTSLRWVERQFLDAKLPAGAPEDDAARADRPAFHAADATARMPKGGPYGPPSRITPLDRSTSLV